MRILDYNFGDHVRIRNTNLIGTVIRMGGSYAIVEFISEGKRDCLRIPLVRLRHAEKWSVIALKSVRRKVARAKKMINYYFNGL